MQTIKEQFKNLLSQEQYNFWIEPTLEIVDEYGKPTLVVKMEACLSVIAMMLKRFGVEGQVIFEVGQKEYQYPTKKPISVCNEAKREEVGQSAQEEYPKSSDVIKSGKNTKQEQDEAREIKDFILKRW
jgi:hypothetical protein